MKYFFPILFLMLAVFGAFAIYKYHQSAIDGANFLANTIDSTFAQ